MRGVTIIFGAPLLLASSFPAEKYELAAHFTSALATGNLVTARKMLVGKPKIHEWSEGENTLQALSNYMKRCPIKSIEGNADININVILDCPTGYHGMSLEFVGSKIREVNFGPPPVIHLVPVKQ